MLICGPDDARQTLGGAQRLRVLLRVVPAAAALKALGLVNHAFERSAAGAVLGVQVAHAALRDEYLDLAMQRVGEVLRQVDGEAVRVFDEVGVDEDLPGLAEAEGQRELLENFAVSFGAFAAHYGVWCLVARVLGGLVCWEASSLGLSLQVVRAESWLLFGDKCIAVERGNFFGCYRACESYQ